MKKVLLSSVAVLSLAVAGAIVYADGTSGGNTGVNNSEVMSSTVDNSASYTISSSEDSLPAGPYTNADSGKDVAVDLSGSQDLTNPGKDTYMDNFGHRQGVEGARTDGSEAYKHDQEFEASKAKAAAPMTADAKAKADKAEAAAAKMGDKAADKAAAKTLPNTAAAK